MMDQTTVTRNIEILHKKGYVNVKTEDTDSRKKSITVHVDEAKCDLIDIYDRSGQQEGLLNSIQRKMRRPGVGILLSRPRVVYGYAFG